MSIYFHSASLAIMDSICRWGVRTAEEVLAAWRRHDPEGDSPVWQGVPHVFVTPILDLAWGQYLIYGDQMIVEMALDPAILLPDLSGDYEDGHSFRHPGPVPTTCIRGFHVLPPAHQHTHKPRDHATFIPFQPLRDTQGRDMSRDLMAANPFDWEGCKDTLVDDLNKAQKK